MTESEFVSELSANVTIVGYAMKVMITQIGKGENIDIPITNNEVCDALIEKVNELIKENNKLKSK